jgi:hypothetical protein
MMDGSVGVESKIGESSKFTVTLRSLCRVKKDKSFSGEGEFETSRKSSNKIVSSKSISPKPSSEELIINEIPENISKTESKM